MRYLIPLMVLSIASCAAITPRLDAVTGTTLEERCMNYRSGVAGLDAIRAGRELTQSEASRRAAYQAFIDGACPPL